MANTGLGRGDSDAVHHRVAQARLRSADLYILTLAFVAFNGDRRHAAQRVGDVGVGQRWDDIGGKNLKDVFCGESAINGLGFPVRSFVGYEDLIRSGSHLEADVQSGRLAGSHDHGAQIGSEANIADSDLVSTGGDICDNEGALAVGGDGTERGLHLYFRTLK